ncbi:MAG: LptA/OstA family protein [Pseudomonadota bacterium]
MKKIFLLLALVFCGGTAHADTSPLPVEITAAKSLEWNRKAKTYVARENVVATQGAIRIQSDFLTARYTDDKGMTDISTLEAEGHVVIRSPPYTATGDKAVYDVMTGNAVMTGEDLKIVTDADIMTAEDKIEFFGSENRLTATGRATVTRSTDGVISADALDAWFVKDATGRMTVSSVTARKHVVVKTAKETATGDSGVYDVPAQKAVLTGKVKIFQGENRLEGTRAEVDMTTGMSRLSGEGNLETEGRVRGVFYPNSQKRKDKKQ